MNETVLSLNNVTVDYGKERILDGVSLDVRAGEILGVRGRNGAGKTTLMEIMAGILKPRTGTRSVEPGLALCYVPQEISLYTSLTGRQNLEFWAESYGLHGKREKARVDYLLQLMGLTEKAKKRVETYSGGMKRRLNMAAALVVTPQLLLLDEPTVGADAASVEVMLSTVKRLAERGAAVVLISHITDDIEGYCTRVIELSEGKLKCVSSPV